MVGAGAADEGRLPFEIKTEDADYSGLSISDVYALRGAFGQSFFNGTDLSNCWFQNCTLANSEFSESKLDRCTFLDVDISGCDFVSADFRQTMFRNCNFAKGEWRDTRFHDCLFETCKFEHDTISLCRFERCSFDTESSRSFEQRSIYFNTFRSCTFGATFGADAFISRNFGVPTAMPEAALVALDGRLTVEQVCRLNNVGQMRVIDFVNATETLCDLLLQGGPKRRSSVVFISLILLTLEAERRISATSLLYLEQVFIELASRIQDQQMFVAAMAVVVDIRSALFATSKSHDTEGYQNGLGALRVHFRFAETFDAAHVKILGETIEEAAGANPGVLCLSKLENGSTLVEYVTSGTLSLVPLLAALQLVLCQAKVVVESYSKLKKAREQLRRGKLATPRHPVARAKVSDILKSGVVTPELVPLKAALRKHGKILIEMDEPAAVTVLTDGRD